jgi:acyl carrier protein
MNTNEIIGQLQDIFRDVLGDDTIVLTENSTANDVEGWDSLTHIQLIVAAEKHFGVKFDSREILSWKNAGELAASIARRKQG